MRDLAGEAGVSTDTITALDEAEVWLEKLAGAERMRSGYQDLVAKGLRCRQERGEQLDRDVDSYAKMAPEALSFEERHQLYRILRLQVVAHPDRSLEVSGALVLGFRRMEMVSR